MRIQTNVNALNAYRNLNITNRSLSKSLERLSSGFRINRAADDAAGLAISEKMRGQIRALNQAVRNAQDGINLIQTAERAMIEVHNNLQRIRELSVQAANDTLTAQDRREMQKEVDQLLTEIDRIGNTTEFNTKKLLDGTTSALTSTDRLETKVFMRDGLRVEDQFGQKVSGGGNYRLDINALPGVAQIQKTDIFKAKHAGKAGGTGEVVMTQVGGEGSAQAVGSESITDVYLAGLIDALEIIFIIDGGQEQVMTITAGEMAAIDTVDAFLEAINDGIGVAAWDGLEGATASVGSPLMITSDTAGSSSSVEVRGAGATAIFGASVVYAEHGSGVGEVENFSVDIASDTGAIGAINILQQVDDGGTRAEWVIEDFDGLGAGETGTIVFNGVTAYIDTDIASFSDGVIRNVTANSFSVTVNHNLGAHIQLLDIVGTFYDYSDEPGSGSQLDDITFSGGGFEPADTTFTITTTWKDASASFNSVGLTSTGDVTFGGSHADLSQPITLGVDALVQGVISFDITTTLGEDDRLTLGGFIFDINEEDPFANEHLDLTTYNTAELQAGFIRDFMAGDGLYDVTGTGTIVTLTQAVAGIGIVDDLELSGAGGVLQGVYSFDIGTNPVSGEIIEIGGETFTFGDGAEEVEIGADVGATAANLATAIDASNLNARFEDAGVAGNTITLTEREGQEAGEDIDPVIITGFGALNTATSSRELTDTVIAGMTEEIYFIVTINSVDQDISLDMSAINTRQQLVDAINEQLTGATASFSSPLVITVDHVGDTISISGDGAGVLFGGITYTIMEPANTIQEISIDAIGGTFTLSFDSETTGPLAYNASAEEIQTALEGLSTIGEGNVIVDGNSWSVTFVNDLGVQRVNLLTINDEHLVGSRGVGDIVNLNTKIKDIDRFWDASGNFLVDDPQTITLIQGDGTKAAFTIFQDDTIGDVVGKIDAAIRNEKTNLFHGTIEAGKGLGQGVFDPEERGQFAYFVSNPSESGFDTVQGTIVINSAIAGKNGEIKIVGDEEIIKALSLTTIQASQENRFAVDVINAHTGDMQVHDMMVTGNLLVGAVHFNVDVEFDSNANVEVQWNEDTKSFELLQADERYETFIHLADSSMAFHIGANPLQDVTVAIGDMRTRALGVYNVVVTDREAANDAILRLDSAIQRVSSQRSRLGALQNRLDHTILNLAVASENLSAAESRIRDVDMAVEMMEFVKNQILAQAGTAMLAQANLLPQMVLQVIG